MLPYSPQRLDMTTETRGAQETAALGEVLGRLAEAGDFLALYGDLGAGKTRLTQGILRGLGVPSGGRSPTFTLINEYQGGRLPIYHMDAYRLSRPEELLDIGAEEYFYGEGLTVLEWADRVAEILPADRLDIRITAPGGSAGDEGDGGSDRRLRRLCFTAHGTRHTQLLADAAREWRIQ